MLRGPVQAVGTGQTGQVSSGVYSGLDSEDDDYQRQLQANRLAAIEAQQQRVQLQQSSPINEQKEQQPKPISASGKIGSSSGVPKPEDKEALRQRRLKFLEQQQQQAQQKQNDVNTPS